MKILKYFMVQIFFKKPILVFGMTLLLFIVNYLSFTAIRSIASTYQGFQEIEVLNRKGNYIANLDPNVDSNFDEITTEDATNVFNYLNKNYTYAFQVDGFVSSLDNKYDMAVTYNYLNEETYKMGQFKLNQGKQMNFHYKFKDGVVPVLIGFGLSTTYPVGSVIEIVDPATNQPIKLKVSGVLLKNTQRSNFYAPNSKNYFNFSIFIPVNKEFLKNSNLDLQVNALMDIVLLQTTKAKAVDLSKFIQENMGLKFNFFTQHENFEYFKDYYTNSLKIIITITFILLIFLTCIAIWSTSMSIRLMIKDFTLNLLVGLSYSKLRGIFYNYFGVLFFVNIIILWLINAFNRYQAWLRKDSLFATYGTLGLINMDWIALFFVALIDIIIGVIIVEISIRKIKKIPISLGVLQ